MALLGTFVDSRTVVALTTGASGSFAHGLPAAPDLVNVYENTTTNNTSNLKIARKYDATNVSYYNHGQGTSTPLRIVSVYFHSIAR